MEKGWIKIHRKLLENPIHKKGLWFSVWIHLLLMASHENHEFIWNGEKKTIKCGQLLTGRLELAQICGVSPSMVERVLKYLENEHQIGQQKTTKYRLITILNWEKYQKLDIKSDNKRTTSGQQADTYKNDKNDKNDKNKYIAETSSAWDSQEYIKSFLEGNRPLLKIIALYWVFKKIRHTNKKQAETALRRDLIPAKNLDGYPADRIREVMRWLDENADFKWTLETVHKYIDEDLSKLTKRQFIAEIKSDTINI